MRDELRPDTLHPARAQRPPSRGLVLTGMILLTGLIAMDQTVVATALPTIVRSIGGFTEFPWVFSAYLLAMVVTIPLYGKLADHFGRKRLVLFGGVLFIAGSALAGLSWSIAALIAFRALQGIGAGAISPLTVTIIGDIYTVEERARVQGLFSSVWGISAVIGPLIGGLFAQFASWRWIFYVNIPLGVLAVLVVAAYFHEHVEHRDTKVDFAGSALLVVGVGALVLALLEGGSGWAWGSHRTIATGAIGIAVLAVFVLWERRAANPIFPLWVFGSRQLTGAMLAALVVGLVTLGMIAYVPTLAQGVFGATPSLAGGILGLLSIGWPVAATLSGRIYTRIGFRDTALIGALFLIGSALLCLAVAPGSSLALLAGACFGVGVGLGLVSTPTVIGAQAAVDWGRRGTVTGAVTFAQMFGSTMSTALFGSLFNSSLAARLANAPEHLRAAVPTPDRVAALLEAPAAGASPPDGLVAFVRGALYGSVHLVFVGLLVAALVGLIVVLATPRAFAALPGSGRGGSGS